MADQGRDEDRRQDQNRTLARAAEYVRMSTDHQRYSTENQSDAIRRYAEGRRIEIVKTYADHGKSGLSINGRGALQRLIDDVRAGRADFTVFSSMTLAAGAASRTPMKVPTTNIFAAVPASRSSTGAMASRMMAVRSRP